MSCRSLGNGKSSSRNEFCKYTVSSLSLSSVASQRETNWSAQALEVRSRTRIFNLFREKLSASMEELDWEFPNESLGGIEKKGKRCTFRTWGTKGEIALGKNDWFNPATHYDLEPEAIFSAPKESLAEESPPQRKCCRSHLSWPESLFSCWVGIEDVVSGFNDPFCSPGPLGHLSLFLERCVDASRVLVCAPHEACSAYCLYDREAEVRRPGSWCQGEGTGVIERTDFICTLEFETNWTRLFGCNDLAKILYKFEGALKLKDSHSCVEA